MAETATAKAPEKVIDIPQEVKPKRQARALQVWKTREEMEKAHPEIKRKAAERAKEKGRKRAGGGKQFRVGLNGENYFTVATGKKDAYARVCAYKGVDLERLDAEAREPRTAKATLDDTIALLQANTTMPAEERKRLAAALEALKASAK